MVDLANVHDALTAGRRPGWSMEAWASLEAAALAGAAGAPDQARHFPAGSVAAHGQGC